MSHIPKLRMIRHLNGIALRTWRDALEADKALTTQELQYYLEALGDEVERRGYSHIDEIP